MSRPKGSKNVTAKETIAEEIGEVPVGGRPIVDENAIVIENLPEIKMAVEADMIEKKMNPSVVQEGEAGINFINGAPHMVIDNQYVPYEEARIILQTRKVVREWIRLENFKKNIKDE